MKQQDLDDIVLIMAFVVLLLTIGFFNKISRDPVVRSVPPEPELRVIWRSPPGPYYPPYRPIVPSPYPVPYPVPCPDPDDHHRRPEPRPAPRPSPHPAPPFNPQPPRPQPHPSPAPPHRR